MKKARVRQITAGRNLELLPHSVKKDVNEILQLSFRSKGEDVEVGSFLNEEDKRILKEEVSEIIEILNIKSYSAP